MAEQVYKVRDPTGAIREIRGPAGASDDEVIAQAQKLFAAAPAAPEPKERSISERAGRVAGLGARNVAQIVSAIPTLGANAVAGLVNLGLEGLTKAGADIDYRMPLPSAELERRLTQVGLPEPETPVERVSSDIVNAMGGVSTVAKGAELSAKYASPVAKRIAELLASNQAGQVVAGAGAGGAGGLARESGAGPTGQVAAALVGGVSPQIAKQSFAKGADVLGDLGAVLAAPSGNQRAINRLAADAVERVAGEAYGPVRNILRRGAGTEYVPGAKATVAEALTEAQMGQPRQIGGAIIRLQKDLTGALGAEDILPTAIKQQKMAVTALREGINEATKEARNLALSTAKRVKVDKIIDDIDLMAKQPGFRETPIVTKTLSDVRERLESVKARGTYADPEDLWAVRKQIGNTIQKNAKETATYDKRLTAGLERDIQKSIDDAMEKGGAQGWKEYLADYSARLRGADLHEERARQAKIIAAGVKSGQAGNLAGGDIPRPPTLLHRPMMFVNFFLEKVSQGANVPVVREVARRMRDPKEMAELMSREPSDPMRKIAADLIRKASVAAAIDQRNTGETQ